MISPKVYKLIIFSTGNYTYLKTEEFVQICITIINSDPDQNENILILQVLNECLTIETIVKNVKDIIGIRR
ncbi:hypothetical protein JO83_03975 [Avibacterium paragallinarum]|nr:hypothetical protein JO83_03975 [Avibacterium paragallinarum]